MINIGLIGFGNVGQGIYNILQNNGAIISRRLDKTLSIKKIAVRSTEKYAHAVTDTSILTTNVDDILMDDSIKIVIEVIGGEQPAFDYITRALTQKKVVVSANKEVISKHKRHFFKMAYDNNVDLYFEAAVGGGIPLIRSLKVGFAANKINAFYGIVNGTTNYILTKIKETKQDFSVVLKKAQELGFAEVDPTMDISGQDAAYKCAILAAVAFKLDVQIDDVFYEGIEKITLKDIEYADTLGYAIKLLAMGKNHENQPAQLQVYPTLIPKNHPLASVHNEFNAAYIVGDQVGESMLMGKGAGASPTASAVISDIMDCCFGLSDQGSRRNLETAFEYRQIMPFDECVSQFFLRLLLKNEPGALEKITLLFSENQISIEKIIQNESDDANAELALIISEITQQTFFELKAAIEATESCISVASYIRLHKAL